jgi:hypothetical protein
MANSINGHQILADTATSVPLISNWIKIRDGLWEGMGATDTLTITDLSGRQFIYKSYAANYPISLGPIGWILGIAFPTLASGQVKIYLDK